MNRAVLILLVLVGALMYSKRLNVSRGIRNNNPTNLENNGIDWVGLSPFQTDSRFYQFTEPKYGIRAAARVLKNYQALHGINTVAGVIDRWAPTVENDTHSYIYHVSDLLGVKPNQAINIESHLVELVEAIIIHENGSNPYSMAEIVEGISLA